MIGDFARKKQIILWKGVDIMKNFNINNIGGAGGILTIVSTALSVGAMIVGGIASSKKLEAVVDRKLNERLGNNG